MKNRFFLLSKVVVQVFFAYHVIDIILSKRYEWGAFSELFDGMVFFCWIVVFCVFFMSDIKLFEKRKEWIQFSSSIIGVLFGITSVVLEIKERAFLDVPYTFTSYYDGGYNGLSLDLREDGIFRLANGGGLGGSYFYGEYKWEDGNLHLSDSVFDGLMLYPVMSILKERDDYYLVPMNVNSELNTNFYSFRITSEYPFLKN